MKQSLTQRQWAALTAFKAGSIKLDKGMRDALIRKGALTEADIQTPDTTFVKPRAWADVPQGPVTAARTRSVSAPDYTSRKWDSLATLAERIERDGVEKVVSFDGIKLVTDKRSYGLAFGVLTATDVSA